LVINPRFLVNGTLNPFTANSHDWTLQGPGQNGCVKKMETVYDGTDSSKDLRRVNIVGDVESFITSASGTYSGKNVQYLAPASGASINYRIFNATDAMIFEPVGAVTLINVTLGYGATTALKNGQTLSIYTSQAIASLTWSSSANVSLFPASMTAGQVVRFAYNTSTNKWYSQ
jgi:hypothetical protein